jgi:peptidyl-prolyl cis-trans isomerase SurA
MKNRTFFSLAACYLLGASLGADVVIVEEIIAKINGDILLRSEYDSQITELRQQVRQARDLDEAQKEKLTEQREKDSLRDLIDRRLMVQRGKEMGVSVEAQVLRQRDELMKQYKIATVDAFEDYVFEQTGSPVEDLMDRMRETFLAETVVGQEVGSRIFIPRNKIEEYYEQHKDKFIREEGVHLLEILISTAGKGSDELEAAEKKVEELHKRLVKGEPFRELAKRHSENERTSALEGDIGIWRRGDLRADIESAVFDKRRGHITDPIKTPNGYLILKVEAKYREGQAELSEVQDEIRHRLMAPLYEPEVRKFLVELREESYIEIRPGYIDSGAVPGKDTSWTDPAKLAPATTTRAEVLAKKKRRFLWIIPLPGGGDKEEKKSRDQTDD